MGKTATEKPVKNIIIAEDNLMIKSSLMRYIVNPAYALHNFPFDNSIDYFQPCRSLNPGKLSSTHPDLAITEINSNYKRVIKSIEGYKNNKGTDITTVVLTTMKDTKENNHALELGAILINVSCREAFVMETIAKILLGEKMDYQIGFVKPEIPELKLSGPNVPGFSYFSKAGSAIYWNKDHHRH